MLIKQITGPKPGVNNSNEYECVYLQVFNNYSGTIPAGGHVCYDGAATTAQFLGQAVTRPATANLMYYAGCAPVAIATKTWGLVQCYGVMEEMGQDGGTTDTVAGQVGTLADATFYPHTWGAGTQGQGWFVSMEAVTTATGTGRGLIRAM